MKAALSLALLLCTATLQAGCENNSAAGHRPFEGVEYDEAMLQEEARDWSGVEVTGRAGMGYPEGPLLPLRETMLFDLNRIDREGGLAVVGIEASPNGDLVIAVSAPPVRPGARVVMFSMFRPRMGRLALFRVSPGGEPLDSTVLDLPSWLSVTDIASVRGDTVYLSGSLNSATTNAAVIAGFQGGGIDAFSTHAARLEAVTDGGGFFRVANNLYGFDPNEGNRPRIVWIPSTPGAEAVPIATVWQGLFACSSGGTTCRATTALWVPQGRFAFDALGHAYIHLGLPYRIDVLDRTGAPVRRIERPHTPVTPAELLSRRESEVRTELLERIRPVRRGAEHVSALSSMLVSPNGAILVNRPDLGDGEDLVSQGRTGESFWDHFSPAGDFTGTIRLPAAFTPLALSEEAVIGLVSNHEVVALAWSN